MTSRPSPDPVYILRGTSSPITSLAFLSDNTLYSGTLDGKLIQWCLSSQRITATLDAHSGHTVLWVWPVAGGGLLTQGRDGWIKSWHCQDGVWINTGHARCATMGFCASAVVSVNNTELIATPSDITSQVDLFDLDKKHHVMTLKPITSQQKVGMCMSITSVNQSGNSNLILTGYENGSIFLWDVRTGKSISVVDSVHTESIMCMAFSPWTMKGVSGSVDNKIMSWTIDSESCIKNGDETIITNPGLNDIMIRSDDKLVASAGWDNNIRLFGLKKMKPLAVLAYHHQSVQCLAFSPDNMLACGSKDQLISVWDVYR